MCKTTAGKGRSPRISISLAMWIILYSFFPLSPIRTFYRPYSIGRRRLLYTRRSSADVYNTHEEGKRIHSACNALGPGSAKVTSPSFRQIHYIISYRWLARWLSLFIQSRPAASCAVNLFGICATIDYLRVIHVMEGKRNNRGEAFGERGCHYKRADVLFMPIDVCINHNSIFGPWLDKYWIKRKSVSFPFFLYEFSGIAC